MDTSDLFSQADEKSSAAVNEPPSDSVASSKHQQTLSAPSVDSSGHPDVGGAQMTSSSTSVEDRKRKLEESQARKAAVKAERAQERQRMVAAVLPDQLVANSFRSKAGRDIDANLLISDLRFRDVWKQHKLTPSGYTRQALFDRALQLHSNKSGRSQASSTSSRDSSTSPSAKKMKPTPSTTVPSVDVPKGAAQQSSSAPDASQRARPEGVSYANAAARSPKKNFEESEHILFIHQIREVDKSKFSKEIFSLLFEKFQMECFRRLEKDESVPLIKWHSHKDGVGIIIPVDAPSKEITRAIVGGIEVDGRFFSASGKGEDSFPVQLRIPGSMNPSFFKPERIVTDLVKMNPMLPKGEGHFVIKNCEPSQQGGYRTLRLLVSKEAFEAIKGINGEVYLYASRLVFFYRQQSLSVADK